MLSDTPETPFFDMLGDLKKKNNTSAEIIIYCKCICELESDIMSIKDLKQKYYKDAMERATIFYLSTDEEFESLLEELRETRLIIKRANHYINVLEGMIEEFCDKIRKHLEVSYKSSTIRRGSGYAFRHHHDKIMEVNKNKIKRIKVS